MKHLTALLLLVLIFTCLHGEILTSGERQLIVDQLSKAGLQENDMSFLKDWVASTYFKVPAVINVLNNPLELPVLAEELKSSADFGDTALFNYLQQYVTQYSVPIDFDVNYYALELRENVQKPNQLFDFVQNFYEMAEPYMNKALKELTPTDRDILRKFAFTSFMESEDSLKYQSLFNDMEVPWGKQEYDVEDMVELQEIIAKVDFPALMEAGYIVHLCAELIKDNYLLMEFKKAKPVTIETRWGWMAFGSPKDDIYKGSYCFIFEPGGNDNYYDITNPANPFQIVIDGKGNDQYAGTKVASLFGAQFSIAIGYDMKGNDVYRGDDFSFASFFGYQFFEDSSGDDIYRGEVYSIASASYGVSVIRDRKGDDRYSTAEYGEGFGSTLGFGTIMDLEGDDFYLAGGKHLHEPLAPFDYLCMAQGFGFGIRPDYAGGIGLLYDRSGNDSYQGGVYSQAGGYWYALG
ncbi:MAG: hypothetical protein JXR56_03680, partial [Candidatus Cloacimonetes bacterium]|nr:hypothetical protein [Candidatus Cloacimonadota bacterium]